jgi:hypothetical protein
MASETGDLQRPSKAQNSFAVALVATVIVAVVIGGWYFRTHRGGAPSGGAVESGKTSGLDSIPIGNFTAQVRGEFKMPASEVTIEFKDSQGQLVDVGQVKLALNMPMPGMTMHDEAVVSGSGGRYTARVKPQMAGSWTAKLSFSGPQGSAENTFPVNVKGGS